MSSRVSTYVIAAATVLAAALATLPESHAKGGKMMGRTSLIATNDGGSGANKPIIRDHRNPRLQTERCKISPNSHFCRDNPNRRRPPDRSIP